MSLPGWNFLSEELCNTVPTECGSTSATVATEAPCHCWTLCVRGCVPDRLLKGMDVPNALQLAAGGVVSRNQLLYLLDRYACA